MTLEGFYLISSKKDKKLIWFIKFNKQLIAMDTSTKYQVVTPSVALQPLIDSYYILEINNQVETHTKIFPTGTTGMVFQYGDRISVTNGFVNNELLPPVFFFGQMKNFAIVKSIGLTKVLVVHFKPSGFYRIFKIPCYLFTNSAVDAEQVLGKSILEILEKIAKEECIQLKFKLVDDFFLTKLGGVETDDLIEESLKKIYQFDGRVSVTQLSIDLNISRRTLERRFIEEVGLYPKLYSNIIKLGKVLKTLNENPHISATTITYNYGFFDQSHFIHAFTSFCGESPLEYISRVRDYNQEMINISFHSRLSSQ